MFIQLTTKDGYTTISGNVVPPTTVFIRTDDIRRILETTEGTKLRFVDGESLLVTEQANDVYREINDLETADLLNSLKDKMYMT